MTSLHLLRHGRTEGPQGFRGRLDVRLSDEGWDQMRSATLPLLYDRIITSPLQRCAKFAETLAETTGIQPIIEADLRELDFGDWEGRTPAELMVDQAEALGRFWADPYGYTPPNGEPVEAFERRVLRAVESLAARFAGERLLVITHGGVIRLLLARARGLHRNDLLQIEVGYAECHSIQTERRGEILWLGQP
ncbi:alpha-ribazole phosphatase family protein [Pseudomonas sp. Marseille-QA0892]